MSLRLRQIVIASNKQETVAKVMADLLEWPIVAVGLDGIRVGTNDSSSLLFINSKKSGLAEAALVDFSVESQEELNDLHQRWQFVKYRYGLKDCKEGQLTATSTAKYFMITDPEGRKWKFSFILPESLDGQETV
jgi:hypothetical protein